MIEVGKKYLAFIFMIMPDITLIAKFCLYFQLFGLHPN